ncbi:NAD(P)-dependent oxidoreductase [Mucilaginibacter ginsenosidivorans]|uniref:SDR family oxidoreductase n=1 Tax=Mucilaginibacter ginsenosidivorans TaxID=398053 RepID=A0A5B8V1K6_9SPHI|nr:SDR family oxidoreductase [Mucilaginibacter ginsenosidivorans]QEC64935.1 SDR family oxidoreductase [Mucilaginibacter ginsenosidivorans]
MKTEQAKLNLLVIGANGGIGRQTVELALNYGHNVTAILRNPAKLPLTHPNLTKIKGDIMKRETFEKYLENQDAVISAIGASGGISGDAPTTLYSQGNANLVHAMKNMEVKRAFFISASAVEISPVLPFYVRFAAKYILQKLLKHMYADLLRMEALVKESGLNWTIIRPPRLTDKAGTGKYRVAINNFLKNALSISRADVAHFMISNLSNEATYQSTIEIAY